MYKLRSTLLHAVTQYDRKQSTKRHYNIYALPQYLGRVQDVITDIDAGAEPIAAISAGFSGPLQSFILKSVRKSHPELAAVPVPEKSSITYRPVSSL